VDNIFTLPFSRSVWLASAGLVAVMGFLLYCALNWERSMNGRVTWSDVALLAVGAVCQQGTELYSLARSEQVLNSGRHSIKILKFNNF
jgi:hypothetical protein